MRSLLLGPDSARIIAQNLDDTRLAHIIPLKNLIDNKYNSKKEIRILRKVIMITFDVSIKFESI